jgi:hypothetical protein
MLAAHPEGLTQRILFPNGLPSAKATAPADAVVDDPGTELVPRP